MEHFFEQMANSLDDVIKLCIFICILIFLAAIICWCLISIIKHWLNLRALLKQQKNPDLCKQNRGIAFNKRTSKLVETRTDKVPFE